MPLTLSQFQGSRFEVSGIPDNMVSGYIRNTFWEFGLDTETEGQPELRRAVTSPQLGTRTNAARDVVRMSTEVRSSLGQCEQLVARWRASLASGIYGQPFSRSAGAAPGCDSGPSPFTARRLRCAVLDPHVVQDFRRRAAVALVLRTVPRISTERGHVQTDERTTIMVQNLPLKFSRDGLWSLLISAGFGEIVNFIYMPIDFETGRNLGYAFVNLRTPDDAALVMRSLEGFCAWQEASSKVCRVTWSRPLQGLSAHIAHFRNSPVMHETVPDSYKPVLLADGKRVRFPSPRKRVRPPRQGARVICIGSSGRTATRR